jgi:hypothetical protein
LSKIFDVLIYRLPSVGHALSDIARVGYTCSFEMSQL